jgi:NADH-quinone oxidoreductase subunit L
MLQLAWVIPALTLLAWVIITLVGKRLPGGGAFVGILAILVGFVMSWGILFQIIGGAEPYTASTTLATFGPGLTIPLGVTVNGLTAVMLAVVTTVSLLVQIYSTSYMRGDVRYTFYFANLSLFTTGMLGVVLSDNLLLLLVGWEVMGLCSYLLIGHYWEDRANSSAAIKAFLVTRVGDVGFLFGIITLFWAGRTFDIARLVELVHSGEIAPGTVTLAAVLLFCGAIGKSAQFPLHVWLPDAMAGPTPVSALIHAATMVAAGVFLVARMFPVFEASAAAMNEIAILASITMLLAALLALVQDDIKRVLAYSTVSQLAYMMAGLGVGGYTAGVFHLFTHAFFKALLFLGAGSIIHAVHTNNMSEMGGLRRAMPRTFWTFVIGSLSLAGIVPLAGFWSKDEILHDAWVAGFGGGEEGVLTSRPVAQLVFVAGIVTAFLTAFYVARMLWLTFGGAYRGKGHPHESDAVMTTPLIVLAIGAAFAGFVNSPLAGDNNFGSWIATEYNPSHGPATLDLGIAAAGTLVALAGLALGSSLYRSGLPQREYLERVPAVWTILRRAFFLDDLYDAVFVRPIRGALAKGAVWFDRNVIDGVVNGLASGTRRVSGVLRYVQNGQVQWYAAALFAGVVVVSLIFSRLVGS